jgi:hypothetical protein
VSHTDCNELLRLQPQRTSPRDQPVHPTVKTKGVLLSSNQNTLKGIVGFRWSLRPTLTRYVNSTEIRPERRSLALALTADVSQCTHSHTLQAANTDGLSSRRSIFECAGIRRAGALLLRPLVGIACPSCTPTAQRREATALHQLSSPLRDTDGGNVVLRSVSVSPNQTAALINSRVKTAIGDQPGCY